MRPSDFLIVFVGAGLGGALRYGISLWMFQSQQPNFLALAIVNLVGSFLVGFVTAYIGQSNERAMLFWGPGFAGGFTTFSAFSYEVLELWRNGKHSVAGVFVFGSVVLGAFAALGGFILGWRMRAAQA